MADDDESLDDILSGPSTELETPETQEQAEQPGQSRDEHGRFAPKEAGDHEVTTEEQPEPDDAAPEGQHNAPVEAVVAERRKRQAAEGERDNIARELSELKGQVSVLLQQRQQPQVEQPKPEAVKPPEFWEAPDKFVEHALSPFQQQIAAITFRASRAEALADHGKEAVTAAETWVREAVQQGQINGEALKAHLAKSADPVGDVVRLHQRSPAVQETTLRQKVEAEILAKYGIDPTKPSTPSPRNPIVKLPPSLNRIPAGHSAPERDESLDEVLSIPRRAQQRTG